MIVFKKVRFKNFLSSGNAFQEVELNRVKTTLIYGKNGSGKSMLTDAITYALYGRPFRKINKPQLINNYNNGNLVVELEFSIGNKEYKVVRGQKPNIFEIYENGKMLDQPSSVYDYQEYFVENILKINYKSFTQIVIVGSATYIPFMQLTPNDRRAIVEDLLNIEIISKMNVVLKKKMTEHQDKTASLKKNIDILKEKIRLHNEYIKTNIQTLDTLLQDTETQILETKNKLTGKEEEYSGIKEVIDELNSAQASLLKYLDIYQKLNDSQQDIGKKSKNIEKFLQTFLEESNCPRCLQPITEEHKKSIQEKKQQELQEFQTIILEISKKITTIIPKIQKYEELRKEITAKTDRLMEIQREMKSLSDYIRKLQGDYEKSLQNKKKVLSSLQENVSEDHNTLIHLLEEEKEMIHKQDIFETILSILKDGGIKTKIIQYYLPTMNTLINKYLTYMNFKIGFSLTENFEEVVKNITKKGFSYENFSEGEKLRIDLAILFAWREIAKMKTNTAINLLIMDEILDSSLDSNGIDDFLSIITKFVEKDANIFVISHKDEQIMDKFQSIIHCDKPDGRFTKMTTIQ